MAASLTSQDVARLLSEPSAETRAELADKLAAELSGSELTTAEAAVAKDIVRILARDIEAKVRASVAEGLRHSRNLPHDVALKLAEDIDQIAMPLLADSLVLTDDDLAAIVRQGSAAKQEAIAGRANLSETVSDALITHAEAPAVARLMANDSAAIAESSMTRAVTRFAGSDVVKEAMVLRPSLPPAIAERLVTLVSREWQAQLVNRHALSPAAAADIVLASREQAILHLSMGASDEGLHDMVAQMHRNRRLTPTLMLRALCSGDIAFFEAAMAAVGDVPLANAQLLIHDPSRHGLVALYRKAALPERLLGTVQAAVEVLDETGFDGNPRDLERFRARVISRVLTTVEALDAADADYLIDKLGDVLMPAGDAAAAG
ncbi:DUF2336 domain-containing protein [Rhodopila globiformis]|uniref:DUF2336 domain-containing protein n=1 Tax=Rhodopila globiformis TaxID=1071 RepID=A0A2S6N9N7_RHOGL|nr:DUF2336 domain-containing protein [Rhodopila globiformis]PPQ31324.1 hypothetical protein CCS01_17500 [Rhodopila globiformis]